MKNTSGGAMLAIGMAIGTSLGVVFENIPIGTAIGLAVGIGLGGLSNVKKKSEKKDVNGN